MNDHVINLKQISYQGKTNDKVINESKISIHQHTMNYNAASGKQVIELLISNK